MTPLRPSQKDIARKAGVSQATVSMALAGHPRIPSETRNHVEAIAAEMGYQPDPYLAGLCFYRNQNKTAKFKTALAWLSNWSQPTTSGWRTYRDYFKGATARAAEQGCLIEEFPLRANGMKPARMEQIFMARNIQGILLPPQPMAGTQLDFCFDRFSVVTFGYTLASPEVHLVTLHHYRAMEMVWDQITKLGYRKPGLILSMDEDERTDNIWSAAFLRMQRSLPARQRVPLSIEKTPDRQRFFQWFERHHPDVVIGSHEMICQWMLDQRIAVPQDVGFIHLGLTQDDSFHAGIWQNLEITGAKAVDFLIDLIHRGERGVPTVRSSLLIDGAWHEGNTLRPQF